MQEYDACADLCSALLVENPHDKAVWLLKTRALTAKMWLDDTDLEEQGVADVLMDEGGISSAPRCVARAVGGAAAGGRGVCGRRVARARALPMRVRGGRGRGGGRGRRGGERARAARGRRLCAPRRAAGRAWTRRCVL
jgi:tetratricopeptide repeat protein 8